MIAAALITLAAAAASSPSTSAAACAAAFRRGDPARVAPGCWRVGPLTLGMSRADVRGRLGEPAASYDIDGAIRNGPAKLQDDVYVFPRDLAARLARRPVANLDFKLLELTYVGARLVRISNAPGARVSAPRCTAEHPAAERDAPAPADFAPFERFAGVSVGDPMAKVRRVLGRRYSSNRPGDFLNYDPMPLTLDSYDGKRLGGFALARDSDTVVQGAAPDITVDLDPATCRTRGFHLWSGPGI